MRIHLTRLLFIAGLLWSVSFVGHWFSADESVPDHWLRGPDGYTKALALQKNNTKPMLVYFTADWCKRCQQMKNGELADKSVINYLSEHVIPVILKPENSDIEARLSADYKVRQYPQMWMVRPDRSMTEVKLPRRNGANVLLEAFAAATSATE